LKTERYFLFFDERVREEADSELIDELDGITDRIFSGIMEEAKGAPIWVALSGGLDSRLVLCKLKQLGYDNLNAFSYGPPGNYEAKAARYVAEKVGVRWVFLPNIRKKAARFFNSPVRKEYWDFSDNLCSLPFMQDIQTLWENRRRRDIPEEAVVINGNSGDFITGSHIPEFDGKAGHGADTLLNAIVQKHFSLWKSLKRPENLEPVKRKILRLLNLKGEVSRNAQSLAKLWELWEWQERQCKFVVNGQRNYDFMGYRWFLPLWDDAYLFFWKDIGIVQKRKQSLYRKYLLRQNWFGVFRDFPVVIWRWPGYLVGIVPIVRGIKAAFGKEAGERVYKMLAYWGHTRHLYAQYSYWYYLEHCLDLRRAHSLNVNRWIEDNGISIA
jgi:asparagine synthase (glutamine-hydrolysing)